MFRRVNEDVVKASRQNQIPQVNGQYFGTAVLNPTGVRPAPVVQPVAPPVNPPPANMVRISGGTFTMGSPSSEPGWSNAEEPQHQVTISSFYMGKYEITVAEFRQFVNATGYRTDAEKDGGGYVISNGGWGKTSDANWRNPYISQGENHPVVQVSWFDAVQYCNWLSGKEKLTPVYTINGTNVTWNRSANGYRLPTEAEWEYACRAGTTTAYNTGASITNNTGWYEANSAGSTQEVGRKPANAWGLHDMHGNVSEWCWDLAGIYTSGAQIDPVGVSSWWYEHVKRGGGWIHSAGYVRSACRGINYTDDHQYNYIGFRLARNG